MMAYGAFSIAVNYKRQEIICTDEASHCVDIRDSNEFHTIKTFGGEGGSDGQLLRPRGVACDGEDRIIVCDSGNRRVQIFSCDGGYLRKFRFGAEQNGQHVTPQWVCVDNDDKMYISGDERYKIYILDKNGCFLRIIETVFPLYCNWDVNNRRIFGRHHANIYMHSLSDDYAEQWELVSSYVGRTFPGTVDPLPYESGGFTTANGGQVITFDINEVDGTSKIRIVSRADDTLNCEVYHYGGEAWAVAVIGANTLLVGDGGSFCAMGVTGRWPPLLPHPHPAVPSLLEMSYVKVESVISQIWKKRDHSRADIIEQLPIPQSCKNMLKIQMNCP